MTPNERLHPPASTKARCLISRPASSGRHHSASRSPRTLGPHSTEAFCRGVLPLQYDALQIRAFTDVIRFAALFDDFIVQYIYLDLDTKNYALANVARVTVKSDGVLAEAKLIQKISGTPGFTLEERHYDSLERVSFGCESSFDSDGFKGAEPKTVGVKNKEYFFLWPMR